MKRMVHDGTRCSYKDAFSLCVRGDCRVSAQGCSFLELLTTCCTSAGRVSETAPGAGQALSKRWSAVFCTAGSHPYVCL